MASYHQTRNIIIFVYFLYGGSLGPVGCEYISVHNFQNSISLKGYESKTGGIKAQSNGVSLVFQISWLAS